MWQTTCCRRLITFKPYCMHHNSILSVLIPFFAALDGSLWISFLALPLSAFGKISVPVQKCGNRQPKLFRFICRVHTLARLWIENCNDTHTRWTLSERINFSRRESNERAVLLEVEIAISIVGGRQSISIGFCTSKSNVLILQSTPSNNSHKI